MNITMQGFGQTSSGEKVTIFKLMNGTGAYVHILDYGCTVQSIYVPDQNGTLTDVCLGYDDINGYESNDGYLGAVVGRFANRIKNGVLHVNQREYLLAVNNGPNHLHGGLKGFDKYGWASEISGDILRFHRCSKDGEEGYPGNLDVTVEYRFDENNNLFIHYSAQADADTVVNMTNHFYANLNGQGSGTVLNHQLKLYADEFTQIDENCLATNNITKVDDTPFDFRTRKTLGRDLVTENEQLRNGAGYDHNFILGSAGRMKTAADLTGEQTGIRMTVKTTMPCIQLYTGNGLNHRGKSGGIYNKQHGVCLETQGYPMECSAVLSPVLPAGVLYDSTTVYCFDTE